MFAKLLLCAGPAIKLREDDMCDVFCDFVGLWLLLIYEEPHGTGTEGQLCTLAWLSPAGFPEFICSSAEHCTAKQICISILPLKSLVTLGELS